MISTDDSFSSENKLYSPKENKTNSYLNSNYFTKPKNSYKKNKFEIYETDFNENSEQQLKYRTELPLRMVCLGKKPRSSSRE
jgi:hypothetical protein